MTGGAMNEGLSHQGAGNGGRFAAAAATGHDWNAATAACVKKLGPTDGCTLGFVYVTDLMAEHMGAIVMMLRGITGIRDWTGTVGIGVLAGRDEFFDAPAIAVLVTNIPPDDYRQFPLLKEDLTPVRRTIAPWLERNTPPIAFVHADPNCQALPHLLAGLSEQLSAFLVGGLTSSRNAYHQVTVPASNAIMPSGPVTSGGVSGVFFAPTAGVQVTLSQGCSPIGPKRTITEAQENVLITIDNRPALDVFKEDIGPELTKELRHVGSKIFAALPIAGSDTGDYLVRNLVGIDIENGWVAIAEKVTNGQPIVFTTRDQPSAEADLRRALQRLKRRAGPNVKGGVYVTCLARGRNTFGTDGREMAIVQEEMGDIPIAGFFASGEISHGRMYGYTGVLTLFT